MGRIEMPPTVFDNRRAEELVQKLAETEEGGWTYVVVHDLKGPGKACVKMVDEFGETVGWL